METLNTDIITKRFMENSNRATGNKVNRGMSRPSKMTKAKASAYNGMIAKSIETDMPISAVATEHMLNDIPNLQNYVRSRGESVAKNPYSLALQAIFLRATEIAKIARSIDMNDAVVVREIEKAESEALNDSLPDAIYILPASTQACVDYFLSNIADMEGDNGSSGTMNDFVGKFSSSNGFESGSAFYDFLPIGYKSLGGTDMGNVSFPDNLFGLDDISPTPNEAPAKKQNLADIINAIVNGISTVGSTVNTVVNNTKTGVNDVLGGVKNAASDVGADSIKKALKEYTPIILGVLGVIVVIIVIAIYASKRK